MSALDDLIKKETPWLKRIAGKARAQLPASVEEDDILQLAMIEFANVASSPENTGYRLHQTVISRFRFAIKDYLRGTDHLSRGMRKQSRRYEAAIVKFRNLNHEASDTALALELDTDLAGVREHRDAHALASLGTLSYLIRSAEDDSLGIPQHDLIPDPSESIEESCVHKATLAKVLAVVEKICTKKQTLAIRYITAGYSYEEVGKITRTSAFNIRSTYALAVAKVQKYFLDLEEGHGL